MCCQRLALTIRLDVSKRPKSDVVGAVCVVGATNWFAQSILRFNSTFPCCPSMQWCSRQSWATTKHFLVYAS